MNRTTTAQGAPTIENPLGTLPIMPLILKFAGPSIISMLTLSLYNITDQVFIGNVIGMLGNAATNVAFPTVTLATGLSMLFGIGTASNFSINLGKGDIKEAKKHVTTGLTSCAYMGIIMFVFLFIFKEQVLWICGATEDCFGYALDYFTITCFGLPLHVFTHAGQNVIRADGSPKYAMACTVSGVLLNVVLDWLFMFPFDMGIKGAALATIIGQSVSFMLCVAYFPRFKAFKISMKDMWKISKKHLLKNMATGIPNFVSHMCMLITNITLNNMLVNYGMLSIYGEDIPLAVSGIAAKVNMIMVGFSVGLAQGSQPIWGFNLGAGKVDRVKGTYKRVFALAFGIGVIAFICFQTFPRTIISLFGPGSDLYFEFAERYLRTFMLLVFFQNIQPVTINYFSAIGYAKHGLIVSISRQGAFLVPLLIILPKFMGLDGVLYASPIADTLAFILSVGMVLLTFKDLEKYRVE